MSAGSSPRALLVNIPFEDVFAEADFRLDRDVVPENDARVEDEMIGDEDAVDEDAVDDEMIDDEDIVDDEMIDDEDVVVDEMIDDEDAVDYDIIAEDMLVVNLQLAVQDEAAIEVNPLVDGDAAVDYELAIEREIFRDHEDIDLMGFVLQGMPRYPAMEAVFDQLMRLRIHHPVYEPMPIEDMDNFETTLVHNDPDADSSRTVPIVNYMLDNVRVASPYPPAAPLMHHFIGLDLSSRLMQRMAVIEHIILKDMGDATFHVNIVMLVSEPGIRRRVFRPTVLVHAELNSNMVDGDLWGPHTVYRGSRWLYTTDKLRRYLRNSGLGYVAVEFREKGFQDNEITPFEQPGSVLDIPEFAEFNEHEGLMFMVLDYLTDYDANITPHLESMQVSWVCWPHNRHHGDYPALVFEFDLDFDQFYWPALAQATRNMLDVIGGSWEDLPILFRWAGTTRLGW
ncbi:uncharacterized protein GGS22DRAFT_194992 [Annulohypoxylon maeteangense]|uniref:uncharacterized protein n=1 Tax=Annulohypoxylon maeteangense TaxID=1927788 RepID=UPI002007A896|nr:uncharacterized protein GGS22DRAFT_194992 [Annulohypoxylon maeteangense]KAI0883770.1 hypothetical protein GGS22DRAFT_194992 [Annulohypoxylon maeteangense]